jgi:HAD superfamily hydrolase (TIGR01509 family)
MHRLAAINVATGKHPLSQRWLDAALEQHDAAVQREDRRRYDLGILVKNEGALLAHQPLGLVDLDDALVEVTAATWAIAKLDVAVRMMRVMGFVMIGCHTFTPVGHYVERTHFFCNREAMLRAVIFDFNGIIVDDEPIHFQLFQKVLGEEKIVLTEEDYYARYLGFDDRGAFSAAYREHKQPLSPEKLSELIERKAVYYQDAIRNHVAIFPGVKQLISKLTGNVPLAVASGALRHEIDTILTTIGLLRCFEVIIASEDVTKGKPGPEVFLKALAGLNSVTTGANPISAAECVVIEDSREGIKGARRAGMRCLAVTNSHPAEALGEANAVVKSLEEVDLNFLQTLCR